MAEYTKLQKQFMATVASNTPEGYHVALGWIDEENGITHDRYLDWCQEEYEKILNTVNDGDTPEAFKPVYTFEEWRENRRAEVDDSEEFSTRACDLCGAKAGSRHHATLMPDSKSVLDGYYAIKICEDCLFYLANGDVPDFNEE